MKKKVIFIICIITLLIIIGLLVWVLFFNKEKEKVVKKEEKVESKKEEIKTTTTSLKMVMVGDALLHNTVYEDAKEGEIYNFTKQLELIKPIIEPYDLAFYNQETVLGGKEIGLSSYPRFNSPQEFGDAMLDAGFNMVSLANNHTLDRGEVAINNSINYWNSKDVIYAGSYNSFETQNEIKIKEVNGIKYTLLAYTTLTNGLVAPQGKEYLVNVYSEEKVRNDVEKVKDLVDVIFVSMHWGVEYTHTPTTEQQNIANFLANLGVDVVIGHHPHVIMPVTKINDTLVFYSLGNFISAQEKTTYYEKLIGLMSSLEITKTVTGEDITVNISNYDNELIYTSYTNWRNYKVVPFRNMNESYNSNYRNLYERYSAIVKEYDQNIPVAAIY